MEERVLLSKFLLENGYRLNRIEMRWHPARDINGEYTSKSREFRRYFAKVYATDLSSGKEERAMVSPEFVVTDPDIHFGVSCDDLTLKRS